MTKFLLCICFCFGMHLGYSQSQFIVINEDSLSVSDFKNRYKQNIEGEGLQQAVQSYINFKLMSQAALNMKVDTTIYYKNNYKSFYDKELKTYLESDSVKKMLSKSLYNNLKNQRDVEIFFLDYSNPFQPKEVNATKEMLNKLYNAACIKSDTAEINAYRKHMKNEFKRYALMTNMYYDIDTLIYNTAIGKCSSIQTNPFATYFVKVHNEKELKDVPPYEQIESEIIDNLSSYSYQKVFRNNLYKRINDKIDVEENIDAFHEVMDVAYNYKDSIENISFKGNKVIWSTPYSTFKQQELLENLKLFLGEYKLKEKIAFHNLSNYLKKDLKENFVIDTYSKNIEVYEPGFKNAIELLRNSLLVNYFVEENIYSKAKQDSIGQSLYLKENQDSYMWPLRYDVSIYRFYNDSVEKELIKSIKAKKTPQEILNQFNPQKGNPIVFITHGKLRADDEQLPAMLGENTKISKGKFRTKNAIYVLNEVLQPRPMTLKEAGETFLEDYQAAYYKKVISQLRAQAQIHIPTALQP